MGCRALQEMSSGVQLHPFAAASSLAAAHSGGDPLPPAAITTPCRTVSHHAEAQRNHSDHNGWMGVRPPAPRVGDWDPSA